MPTKRNVNVNIAIVGVKHFYLNCNIPVFSDNTVGELARCEKRHMLKTFPVFGLVVCVCKSLLVHQSGQSVLYLGPNSVILFSRAAFTAQIFSSSSVRLQACRTPTKIQEQKPISSSQEDDLHSQINVEKKVQTCAVDVLGLLWR